MDLPYAFLFNSFNKTDEVTSIIQLKMQQYTIRTYKSERETYERANLP